MSSYNSSTSTSKNNTKNKSLQGKADHHIKAADSLKNDTIQHKSFIDNHINKEDITWQDCVKQVMDLTLRSEDEVIMALHDSDGDLNRAVNDLLEGISPEWEVKKRKARQSGGPKQNSELSPVSDNNVDWDVKRCLHNDGSSRIRGQDNHNNRGWRRRENKENEKNVEDSKYEISSNGNRTCRGTCGRSGRGGRGGGRGLGPRTFANRGESSGSNAHSFTRPIDTWTGNDEPLNNCKESKMGPWCAVDTTEDWDNEEYTGSLADTKVFTPSALINEASADLDETNCEELLSIKSLQPSSLLIKNDMSNILDISTNEREIIIQNQNCQRLTDVSSIRVQHSDVKSRESLSVEAHPEYFTQLTQQANDCPTDNSEETIFLSVINNQSQRQAKHRPRVPPPSKIPATAVEMPGDALNSSISFLDVQFGALEFGSDASINDGSNQDRYNPSGTSPGISSIESTSNSTKTIGNSISSLTVEGVQVPPSQKFSATTLLRSDNPCMASEQSINSEGGFTNRNPVSQSADILKQDLNIKTSLSNSTTFNASVNYQSPKSSYPTAVAANNYNTYSCNSQSNQTSFTCPITSSNTNSFSAIQSVTQAGYNSSYTQSSVTTFTQVSPSSATSCIYNQTSTTSQGFQSTPGFTTTPISQYQSQSVSTNASNNSSYLSTGYQNPSTFQSAAQTYHPSNTTFASSISQGSSVYSTTVHSVYSNAYPGYGSQDHKLTTNKDLQFENNTTVASTSLVTTAACTLSLTSNTSQTKTTASNTVPKNTSSGLPTSSVSSTSSSVSGSGSTGNMAPILSHQYIMGQSVPYATFQQPHMYSYEDLQLMQQRMPHMPTTGYYDATVGYQTTGPVTSLGNTRSDTLSGVQGVQGVQAVQGQFTGINDARFTRTDSNASPVSSSISQQTATQHQQPLMNPIPPGYAYFYGGGIMPASGFQYGTPAIYPQIAAASNAGATNGAYNTKPGNYSSGYGSGTNYDTLSNSGPSGDFKSSTSGYNNSQTAKNSSTSGNTNTVGTSTDINTTMYTKGHVSLNKVNSYEKQTFHSATPPPFGLTNNQSANVISGYGTTHLFIPTVPHQLHQPLHQESGNNAGQRINTNSQNKAQLKPGYGTSYWAGGNQM